jgi:hypothetical protein
MVLKLTLAGAGILVLIWIAMKSLQFVGDRVEHWGHGVGGHCFVQLNHELRVLRIYWNGYDLITFGYTDNDFAPWSGLR